MLLGIFDPELMNQFNGMLDNFLEVRKENPNTATIIMWSFGFILWGVVAYYRRNTQPVVWGDIGKALFEALNNKVNSWKWVDPTEHNKKSITCEDNGQKLSCYGNCDFYVNENNVMKYLSKREKKELVKLKNKIICLLNEADSRELERKEEEKKANLLNSIQKVVVGTPKEKVSRIDSNSLAPSPMIPILMPRTPSPKEEEEEKEKITIYLQQDFEAIFKSNKFSAKEIEILDAIFNSNLWRWGKDSKGVVTRNSIRTDRIIWNFNDQKCYIDGLLFEIPEGNLELFENCFMNIINAMEYNTFQNVYRDIKTRNVLRRA